jgi:hypothetical protein
MSKLTASQIENFVSEFNSCFGDDWLPEHLARASVAVSGGIRIFIGNRDIQFDEQMHIIGRGTDLTVNDYGEPIIERPTEPPTNFTPLFKDGDAVNG